MRQSKLHLWAVTAAVFLAAACQSEFSTTTDRIVRRAGMADDRPPVMLSQAQAAVAWNTLVRRRGPLPVWTGAPQIFVMSGDNQSVPARSRMQPIEIKFLDANGAPVPNVTLSYGTSSYMMVLPTINPNQTAANYNTSVTTDATGIATIQPWVGPAYSAGAKSFTISGGTSSKTITFSFASQVNASGLTFSTGNGQSVEAGREYGTPFTAFVTDGSGNPLPCANVTFSINAGGGTMLYTASGSGPATSTTSVTLRSGTDGQCNVRVLAPPTPGTTTITAAIDSQTATATGTVTSSSTPVLTQISPTGNYWGLTGTTTAPFTVRMLNADGSPAVGQPVNFSLSGLGSLTMLSAVTDASGYATTQLNFPTNTLGATQTSHRVSASSPAAFGTVTFPYDYCQPGPDASWYQYSGDNQSAIVGQAAALPLVAAFKDQYGNPLNHWLTAPTVTVSVVSGDAVFNGLPGPLNVTTSSVTTNRTTVYVTPKTFGPTVVRFTCVGRPYAPIDYTITGT
jgi:hypothetical protein